MPPFKRLAAPFLAAPLALGLLAALGPAPASAQDKEVRVEFGMLTCTLSDKTNLIIVSSTKFACVFEHADERPPEELTAEMGKLGADLTIKADETLKWAVLAPSIDAEVSAMEGDYIGVGADIAAGKGVGANALLGGFDKSFALQPISVSTSDGVGASLAIEMFSLTYVGLAQ
ncbi:DUF992 domain-containing protein [Albimonas sp. CAU 1670]|uniref:DUF992 domain-containing protein n=1 Tax=Albimonas sp. CAU 1670 TaxID=3032599 RepID=UPI0023DA6689|nr:DUF992 domain-containing protein [Albimonas sp. CAU 1670]MDF2231813.1 DUF992 domain-containing protein [Albimonas sp. CAU 1670]